MMRSVAISVAACIAISGIAATAHAESGMLPNGAQVKFNKVLINEDGASSLSEPSTPEALREYLNLAHCVCSQSQAGSEQSISYELALSLTTGTNRPAEIWVGTQCDDDTLRGTNCRAISSIPDIDLLATRPENVTAPLYDVINGAMNTAACQQRAGDAYLWVLVDHDGDNTYDYFGNQSVGKTTDVTGIDTEPPPLPTAFTASSAEGAILLEWTPPEARATDVFHYQALCVGPAGTPVLASPPEAKYQTVRTLCDLDQDIALGPSEIDSPDAGTVSLSADLQHLDPRYVCGSTSDSTATGLLIEGLENDVPYTVVLLAIDNYGNATGTYFTKTITPRPATDFWEDLHDRGSNVEGGFCLIAETFGDDNGLTQTLRAFRDDTLASSVYGRVLIDGYYATLGKLGAVVHGSLALRVVAGLLLAPLVAVALVWHALSLGGLLLLIAAFLARGWLWRRRPTLGLARLAVIAGAALVLLPHAAHAQGTQPYWEEDPTGGSADESEGLVRWHFGIRLGPYTPGIDDQFGMDPGPYKDMFGGYQVLPMLDLDRILWNGFGQVGVGGSIGYMQKTAKAWADGSTPGDPMRERSDGDTNSFKLMPLAISGIYRFTYLDDEYGIPVVPYARVGLAYYLWWVRTNGNTAASCFDGTRNPDCDKDKAIGASAGIQGSLGLAIRAERIDASAATSMKQSGIQHAGFYAEWQLAKVDGFGSDEKLSVGDSTWFVGANFEF